MKVFEQTKVLDGLAYDLAVRDEGIGFFGTYFCRDCHKGFVKYELAQTVEEAFAEAERGAMAHHEAEHRSVAE